MLKAAGQPGFWTSRLRPTANARFGECFQRNNQGGFQDLTAVKQNTSKSKASPGATYRPSRQLRWELDVNKAIAGLSDALIDPASSIEQIADIVLHHAKQLTSSEHGYVASIDPKTGDMIAHTNTQMIDKQCRVSGQDKRIIFPKGPDGLYPALWGWSLNTRQAFYTNTPQAHQASKGLPPGHVPVNSFLAVPALVGSEVVGQIALANSVTGFNDRHLDAVSRIAKLYAAAIHRKRAEDDLALSKERYALAQRVANIGSWDWNILTNELTWSEQIEPMFGFGPGQFQGTYHAFLQCVHPDDRQWVIDSVQACVEQGKEYNIEHRIVWPDGTIRWVSENGNVIRDGSGRAVRMLGIVEDITDRKIAEDALRLSEQEHRSLVEKINDGLAMTDRNFFLTFVNDRFADILERSREELLGHHLLEFVDDDYKPFMQQRIDSNDRSQVKSYELGWKTGTGQTVYTLLSPAAFFDPDGNFTGSLSVVTDISERKEAEARHILAEKILRCLNQKNNLAELVHEVIGLIRQATRFAAVGIRLRDKGDFPYFEANGFSDDFVRRENGLCAHDHNGRSILDENQVPLLECMCGNVIAGKTDPALSCFTEGGSFWTNSTTKLIASLSSLNLQIKTRNTCNQVGYESVALFPLRSGDQIVGLLQMNDNWPNRFTPEMIRFFERMGASIGIALARISAEQEAQSQAKFPSENPNPVCRISTKGILLYANSAGSLILDDWNCQPGRPVPEKWRQIVLQVFCAGICTRIEDQFQDKIFSFVVVPIIHADYVNLYGLDITTNRKVERELDSYRRHLEDLVKERTIELTDANARLLQEIEQRKRLEREILKISEREQRSIGQELHDSLGQQLTGIALMVKVLERKLAEKMPDQAAAACDIARLVNQATDQTRSLARGLHPIDLDSGSLTSVIQELAASSGNLFGVSCHFVSDDNIDIKDGSAVIHLYRIVQETINNAVKHGKAKNIWIELAARQGASVLTIENDGIDFHETARATKGMGLRIMEHRAEMINASLDVTKRPDGGTIVTCMFDKNTKVDKGEENHEP